VGLIVEERTYHVITGKLPEVVRLYTEEGSPVQQEHLGNLVGAFDSYAERERRRALLQADQRWKDFLPRLQPLIHTQRTRILLPTSYSPVR
jgi:NIPSNAP